MTREQLEISIQSNMPTNGVGFITAEHTRQVAHDMADYVDSEIEGVEVDVTDLDNRMTQAETDIDNLETRMDTAEGDINSLEDRVGITEQDISQIKPVVAQHTIDINNLDGRMDTAEDDIDALETRVDGISGDITGLDSRVDILEDKVDVLEPKVDQNTLDIDNLKTRVTQNERDINSLDGRMDTAEDDINNIEDDVNMAQRDITNLQGRIQRAEGDIQNIEANHYTKAESDGRYEQLINKATDFTVINDVKYPTTKAVVDYAYQKQANGIPKTDLAEDVQESLDKANTAVQEEDLINYAKVDGYYETMGVGTANNLAGQTESINDSKFRTSGGTTDIGTGTMRIEDIRGNSIVYNQITTNTFPITNILDNTAGTTMIYRSSGIIFNTSNWTQSTKDPHKVLFYIDYTVNEDTVVLGNYNFAYLYQANNYTFKNYLQFSVLGNHKISFIADESANDSTLNIAQIYYSCGPGSLLDITYNNFKAFDLTLIYGAGNEPGSPELFEDDYKRWFGKSFTEAPYNKGSINDVQDITYKTVGFNLLNPTTGKAHLVGTYGNTDITQGLYCYEITGNYTSITDEAGNTITPENGFFMVDDPQEITVEGANENTCIHLTWSGWRNGETEAYQEHLADIPVTQITGKLNGEGESVVVFPDGMKSAGDVYDEIYISNNKVYAIKRVGSVDMGTQNWWFSPARGNVWNSGSITNLKRIPDQSTIPNMITSKYVTGYYNNRYDKTISQLASTDEVCINDELYKSVDNPIKPSLQGVLLYYEFETPEVYEIDNFELPIRTYVNDFGTEEQISDGIAANIVVKYAVNAVDLLRRLPENYISSESMDNFLAALGAAMNGTWTKTWNSNNQVYNFSFVVNPEPEPTPDESTNSDN